MTENDAGRPAAAVDLTTCAQEPIHIPGAIQPHGAMLVFDREGRVASRSANADQLLGRALPAVGAHVTKGDFDGQLPSLEASAFGAPHVAASQVNLGGQLIDIAAHESEGSLIVEFEPRPSDAPALGPFGLLVHTVTKRLQRQESVVALLDAAVEGIREMTGFDRVMAYRFLPDHAGEILSEAKRHGLEPFLGLRYPSTDIPAQARRLYTLNPIRLIADVGYRPNRLQPTDTNPVTGQPLDLSHAMLRSVSPIHIEYLTNMGVGASMSISLIVDGRLWGLIACHHMSARHVAYNVRVASLMLSETLSLLVARAVLAESKERLAQSERARTVLVGRAAASEDLLKALVSQEPSLLEVVPADGAAIAHAGRIATVGAVPDGTVIRQLLSRIETDDEDRVFVTDRLKERFPQVDGLEPFAGILSAQFDEGEQGSVLWFRVEQVQSIHWARDPNKKYSVGPHGSRLTPPGSFEIWKEETRGRSEEWHAGEVDSALRFRDGLLGVALRRAAQMEKMQRLLIGMLGHDLRNPLNAISVAVHLMSAVGEQSASTDMLGQRIATSTSRMRNLVDSMLDYSRVQTGQDLPVTTEEADIHEVIKSIVEETRFAFPGSQIELKLAGDRIAAIDKDRIEQVVSNLLSNARHHGDPSRPIRVDVGGDQGFVTMRVSNHGPVIAADQREAIFEAFKSLDPNRPGRQSLGLGLFICRQIVESHRGTIDVESADGLTHFDVLLPRRCD